MSTVAFIGSATWADHGGQSGQGGPSRPRRRSRCEASRDRGAERRHSRRDGRRRGRSGRCRGQYAAGRQAVLSVWGETVERGEKGRVVHDFHDRSTSRARASACPRGEGRIAVDRCARIGRHRRREGGDADFMCGGEATRSPRPAHPGGDGQAHRPLRRRRRGTGSEDCNDISRRDHDSKGEAFVLAEKLGLSPQALFDVASTSSGQSWSLTSYWPVPGPVPVSPANDDHGPGFAAASCSGPKACEEAALAPTPRRRSAPRPRNSIRSSAPPDTPATTFPALSISCAGLSRAPNPGPRCIRRIICFTDTDKRMTTMLRRSF